MTTFCIDVKHGVVCLLSFEWNESFSGGFSKDLCYIVLIFLAQQHHHETKHPFCFCALWMRESHMGVEQHRVEQMMAGFKFFPQLSL